MTKLWQAFASSDFTHVPSRTDLYAIIGLVRRRVIKVERPGVGDITRGTRLQKVDSRISRMPQPQQSFYHARTPITRNSRIPYRL